MFDALGSSGLRAQLRRVLATVALAIGSFTGCTVTTDLPVPCPEACESIPGAEATCTDGRCEITCDEGLGDCDGDPTNGCEIDLTSDDAHCGSCDQDCRPAICESSACVPTVVFSEQSNPSQLALDAEHVYWVNQGLTVPNGNDITFPFGSVQRARRSPGGAVEVIANDQRLAFDLAVDETHVYWTAAEDGTLMRWPLDGSSGPEAFVSGLQFPIGVDVDATHAYYVEAALGSVSKVEKTSGVTQTLATDQAVPALVRVDGRFLYWTNNEDDAIRRISLDAPGVPERLGSGLTSPLKLAISQDFVFVTNDRLGGIELGALVRIAKDGGEVVQVTTGATGLGGMTVIGDMLYFSEGSPRFSLRRRPIDLSREAETIISGLEAISDIAGDANGIYFLTLDGSVWFHRP